MALTPDLIARAKAGDPDAMRAVYEAASDGSAPHDNAHFAGVEVAEKVGERTVLCLVTAVSTTET